VQRSFQESISREKNTRREKGKRSILWYAPKEKFSRGEGLGVRESHHGPKGFGESVVGKETPRKSRVFGSRFLQAIIEERWSWG